MSLFLLALAIFCLAIGAAAVVVGVLCLLQDQRELQVLSDRLSAEQRLDAATRATLQAMRAAVRSADRP